MLSTSLLLILHFFLPSTSLYSPNLLEKSKIICLKFTLSFLFLFLLFYIINSSIVLFLVSHAAGPNSLGLELEPKMELWRLHCKLEFVLDGPAKVGSVDV